MFASLTKRNNFSILIHWQIEICTFMRVTVTIIPVLRDERASPGSLRGIWLLTWVLRIFYLTWKDEYWPEKVDNKPYFCQFQANCTQILMRKFYATTLSEAEVDGPCNSIIIINERCCVLFIYFCKIYVIIFRQNNVCMLLTKSN